MDMHLLSSLSHITTVLIVFTSCVQYHGFCHNPDTCRLSHDVDRILDYDEAKQLLKMTKRRRKRQSKSEQGSAQESETCNLVASIWLNSEALRQKMRTMTDHVLDCLCSPQSCHSVLHTYTVNSRAMQGNYS